MEKVCAYWFVALFTVGLIFMAGCEATDVPTAPDAAATQAGKSSSQTAAASCIPAPDGLLSWWPGDGDATDIQGGRDGTLVNGATFAPGMVGQAFHFDGVNDYVSVPDDPIWTLGDNPFTIDLWVNFDQVRRRDPFVGHDESGGEFNKWIFWYDASGHRSPRGPALRFHINSPTLPPLDPVVHPWVPVAGRWYHVAVTRSGPTYTLYLDGALVASQTDANTIPDPNFPLTIGRAERFHIAGRIDEVEIFTRALAPEEIAALFNAGSAGKCKFITVEIDIKPGSDPNTINCNNAQEVIAVALLTTEAFDATTVDHTTVTFEGAGETHVDKKTGQPHRHEEDVDGDGDIDLVFHFRLGETGLDCASTEGTLTGETFGGQPFEGTDAVRMVEGG